MLSGDIFGEYRIKGQALVVIAALVMVGLLLAGCSTLSPGIGADRMTLEAVETELSAQASQIAAQGTLISHLATRPAMLATPPSPGAQPTPYRPVTGFVEFEDGRCCIGGRAGSQVTATLRFEAESPTGQVTQMRFRVAPSRFQEADFTEEEWQPYVPEVSVQIPVALNWTGFYASVQFRDQADNLSPVVYDDISVEGSP